MPAPKCSCDTYDRNGLKNICSTAGDLQQRVRLLNHQVANLTRQRDLAVDALENGHSTLHKYNDGSECKCSQCMFVRMRAEALSAIKESES